MREAVLVFCLFLFCFFKVKEKTEVNTHYGDFKS